MIIKVKHEDTEIVVDETTIRESNAASIQYSTKELIQLLGTIVDKIKELHKQD